jgi:hypothetical protein
MIYAIALILLALSEIFEPGPAARCDPALAAQLVPAHPRLGTYEVCESADLPGRALSREGFHAGEPERLEILDALGTAGTFDRTRMTQLFRGRRVEVRRGWRLVDGRFETMTEISPYPNASLSNIEEGTLIIRWAIRFSPGSVR